MINDNQEDLEMPAQAKIKELREEIVRCREEYNEIKGRLKELEEQEEHLEEELERVRQHLSYYSSLVKDMKKEMKGIKGSSRFGQF